MFPQGGSWLRYVNIIYTCFYIDHLVFMCSIDVISVCVDQWIGALLM